MMSEPLRWGILGTGNIANQFAHDVRGATRSEIVAVGSRSHDRASAFAGKHQIAATYDRYDKLLADQNVQAVYISLPNSMHYPWTLKALEAGKHVLCEKPLAANVAQAREMFGVAEAADRLLVEAFMYVSHPLTKAVLAQVHSRAIGRLQMIRTSFCYRTRTIEGNVRFSRELAGGGLMDVGCYCVHFSRLFAGAQPQKVYAAGRIHDTGIDDMAAGTMIFPGGVIASFVCGMSAQTSNAAFLCGDEGYIEVPIPWKPPVQKAEFSIRRATPPRMDQTPNPSPPPHETFYVDAGKPLYALEADQFAAAVLDGSPPSVSRDDTLGNMHVLDEMRRQIGLSF